MAIANSVVFALLDANNDPQVFYVMSFIVFYTALGRFCYQRALDAGKKPVVWVVFGCLPELASSGSVASKAPNRLSSQYKTSRAVRCIRRTVYSAPIRCDLPTCGSTCLRRSNEDRKIAYQDRLGPYVAACERECPSPRRGDCPRLSEGDVRAGR